MTAVADQPVAGPAFSPKVILALVLVGIVAFAGLAVLSAFARRRSSFASIRLG